MFKVNGTEIRFDGYLVGHLLDDDTKAPRSVMDKVEDTLNEWADPQEAYDRGYDEGYDDAADRLRDDADIAYQDGEHTGYTDGEREGFNDCRTQVLDIIRTLQFKDKNDDNSEIYNRIYEELKTL